MNKDLIEQIETLWWPDGHLNNDQRDFLIELLVKLKPRYCIETGFATGRSAVTTLCAANPEVLISIDIDLNYMNAKSHANLLQNKFKNFKVIESDSSKVLVQEFFDSYYKNGIDFAFIDGSHTYAGAYYDISTIYNQLNIGGIMVIDDFESGAPNGCEIQDVNNAVYDFCSKNNIELYKKWNKLGKGFAILKK